MSKKNLIVLIICIVFIVLILGICMYYVGLQKGKAESPTKQTAATNQASITDANNNKIQLTTEGNNMVIQTKSKSTIRVINEYDVSLLKNKKSLLIMWGSWCPNCTEEMTEIEKILKKYKNDASINIILVAHEYSDTVQDLIEMLENDVSFDTEILLDLGRIIRKTIDPEASTVPVSYLVDKNGNILKKHNDSITLKKAQEMIETN